METIIAIIIACLALLFVIYLFFVIPMEMAQKRNRSAVIWVLISLFVSPFVETIGLWILGDA